MSASSLRHQNGIGALLDRYARIYIWPILFYTSLLIVLAIEVSLVLAEYHASRILGPGLSSIVMDAGFWLFWPNAIALGAAMASKKLRMYSIAILLLQLGLIAYFIYGWFASIQW